MSYRRHGHARVDSNDLDPFAICDRCGMLYNLSSLSFQKQYAGSQLITYRILVCQPCLDVPQEQLRTITLPADPVALRDTRPDSANNSTSYLTTETAIPIATENGNLFIID